MARKKLYFLIIVLLFCIAVGGYFWVSSWGKYEFKNQEVLLSDCDGDDCAEVCINYLVCKRPDSFAKAFNDSIQRQIIQKLLAKDTLISVEEAGKLFLSQYKTDKLQFEGIAPYQIQITDTITFQNDDLVSLQRTGSEYLGGAHSIEWKSLLNFKPTGTPYTLEELFSDNEKVVELAEKYFRETYNIAQEQGLKEEGFLFENDIFTLPKNIGFSEKFLILIYNPYEIAPYSTGTLEVKIPLSEVTPWLSFNINKPKK